MSDSRTSLIETVLVVSALHAYALFWRPALLVDLVAVLVALAVVLALFRRRGETARSLGITGAAAARAAARRLVPLVALIAAGATAARLALGGPLAEARPFFPGFFIALVTYPLWGFLQQLFYLGFVSRGLVRAGASPTLAAVIAGTLYGLVHAPNWPLVGCTVPLGLWLALVYARAPGLLPIGIAHGIGGAFALYVLGLDLEIGARLGR